MTGHWVPQPLRDEVVEFIETWKAKTTLPYQRFLDWIGLTRAKYTSWKSRVGEENQHNGQIPREHWLLGIFAYPPKKVYLRFHLKFKPLHSPPNFKGIDPKVAFCCGERRVTKLLLDDL